MWGQMIKKKRKTHFFFFFFCMGTVLKGARKTLPKTQRKKIPQTPILLSLAQMTKCGRSSSLLREVLCSVLADGSGPWAPAEPLRGTQA